MVQILRRNMKLTGIKLHLSFLGAMLLYQMNEKAMNQRFFTSVSPFSICRTRYFTTYLPIPSTYGSKPASYPKSIEFAVVMPEICQCQGDQLLF